MTIANPVVFKLWSSFLCAMTAAIVVMLVLALPAFAQNDVKKPLPNIVLVHGAWADGSSWSAVIERLQAADYNVIAMQLPLTSLADDVAHTRRVLAAQTSPTLVVGHSYGGVVIGELGNDAPNVIGLVYVAAFALDEGESIQALLAGGAPPSISAIHMDDEGFLSFDAAGFVTFVAPDIDPVQARVLAAVQKPVAAAAFATPSGMQAWHTLPTWYLIAENDQIIPAPAQQAMADHIGAITSRTKSSHMVMLAQPEAVTDFIMSAAQSLLTAQ